VKPGFHAPYSALPWDIVALELDRQAVGSLRVLAQRHGWVVVKSRWRCSVDY
jgi:hypothetical protein